MQRDTPKGRLHHAVPGWVADGSLFHVRVRAEKSDMTEPVVARRLIESVGFYQERQRWFCRSFLLRPDHWHAVISFPRDPGMSATVQAWKAFHRRTSGVVWRAGYFDHRLRNEKEVDETITYIGANPVVKGLCARADEWLWRWPQ